MDVLGLVRSLVSRTRSHDEYIEGTRDVDGQWESATIDDGVDRANDDTRDVMVLKRTLRAETPDIPRGREETAEWLTVQPDDRSLVDLRRWR